MGEICDNLVDDDCNDLVDDGCDYDEDFILNEDDNCPSVFNPNQSDIDNNVGDDLDFLHISRQ